MRAFLFLAAALAAVVSPGVTFVTHREATNVAERVVAGQVRTVTTPIPESKTNLVSYVNRSAHPVTGEVRDEDEDGSVVIGKGASGTIASNYIAGVTSSTRLRSEAVAIGHNATVAFDGRGDRVQGIAIGWNAKADGSNVIAIGSGAKHWYELDEEGDRTYARGSETVALGYCARATANCAVQIGKGINTVANSLKFRDAWIVRNGRLASVTDTNDVIAIIADYFRPQTLTNLDEIAVRSHALSVYAPETPVGEEIGVSATGTRNYEILLPDTEEIRSGLPFTFDADFAGAVKYGSWWTNRLVRLPALVIVREPVRGTCILTVKTYDDGRDWTPVVVSAVETNGCVEVRGTNLHAVAAAEIGGTRVPVGYPLYAKVTVRTNGVAGASGWLLDAQGERTAGFTVE